MCSVNIHNVLVDFPFPPYPVQFAYMEKVIECLQKGENGLLESPTGTGKTLSILCSSLAWLTVRKAQVQSALLVNKEAASDFSKLLSNQLENAGGMSWGEPAPVLPKIIYASRTHSQLTQVIQELKRSKYNYLKVAVLGSRDQMCIHPEVSKETNSTVKLYMCMAKTSTRTCHYYNNVETVSVANEFTNGPVMDIEDLVKEGQKQKACPYFLSREMKKNADIIFMPYNYLLDPKIRKMHGVEIEGNIIIFDEAHNIEKICEESASVNLRSADLALAIDETNQVLKLYGKQDEESESSDVQITPQDFGPDELLILKGVLLDFEKVLDDIEIENKAKGLTREGRFIRELLLSARVQQGNYLTLLELLDKVIQYLSANSNSPFQRKGAGLQTFADLIKVVFAKNQVHFVEKMNRAYRTHFGIEESKSKSNRKVDEWLSKSDASSAKQVKTLNYWCFSPGFGMEDLIELKPRCIILTSGTLSPLDSFAAELHVPFPVTLENPHIIQEDQVLVAVLQLGPNKVALNSSYNNRSNPEYLTSLGKAIFYAAKVTPHGMLVFFPSYPVMKSCIEHWQNEGQWGEIMRIKPIYVEPQTKETFNTVMKDYYKAIDDPVHQGAIFMAVCRGKVSEGLDFINANGRTVVITGLPYPPLNDPRVILKKEYLEENRKAAKGKGLTGQDWYRLEAIRAVNQAIGRVIRHKEDYGAILFFDQRFGDPNIVNSLSSWVRKLVKRYDNPGKLIADMRMFFKHAADAHPVAGIPRLPVKEKSSFSDSGRNLPVATLGASGGLTSGNLVSARRKEVRPHISLGYEPSLDVSQYATNVKPVSPKPKSSLFENLNSISSNVIDFNNQRSDENSDLSISSQPFEPMVKKRKLQINMKYGQLNDSDVKPSSCTETVKEVKPNDYLMQVKTVLCRTNEYEKFKSVLKSYRSDKDISILFEALRNMFGTRHKNLVKGFRTFVFEKSKFDELCLQHGFV
ncbi:regulator of telomere elongation helicase 1 homolog isoform X1 [Artemia franciscana]|uniref:Regulator of telomere elongation helicase 1 homolog n=2 Tax=Artemia franciscana TaxID=6661 RepID=A0AA88LBY4_ARTSF|nr:hypothetical protein QYM36_001312 [Artemia franciscana]